jgi:hypothetical protein
VAPLEARCIVGYGNNGGFLCGGHIQEVDTIKTHVTRLPTVTMVTMEGFCVGAKRREGDTITAHVTLLPTVTIATMQDASWDIATMESFSVGTRNNVPI